MPLIGYKLGDLMIENMTFNAKYLLFIIFLIVSVDMFISFFEQKPTKSHLGILNIVFVSLSVSIDSLTIGFGIEYLFAHIIVSALIFCFVSMIFTILGIAIGKVMSKSLQKYAYLLGGTILFAYSILVLTN